ncbi:MAG: hypothetical protein JXR91_13645 [Deltaproteobacteria bacterium]|nr:hypothetical protein [Deltaproteobacteria bacterium]
MNQLRDALEKLGVDDLHFWVKARPENITHNVLKAARRLGVGQVFLGIEQVTLARLKYLGRIHTPEDNHTALSLLKEYNIQSCFNLMMFDPDCNIDEVDAAISFARQYADVPWNICRTEIYPGTTIYERLQNARRLTGDFIHTDYTMTDPACELMFSIMRVAFFNRSFNVDSLINRLATLFFTLEATSRLCPGEVASQNLEAGQKLLQIINLDTANRLQMARDFVKSEIEKSPQEVQLFAMNLAMDMNDSDHLWHQEINGMFDKVERQNN